MSGRYCGWVSSRWFCVRAVSIRAILEKKPFSALSAYSDRLSCPLSARPSFAVFHLLMRDANRCLLCPVHSQRVVDLFASRAKGSISTIQSSSRTSIMSLSYASGKRRRPATGRDVRAPPHLCWVLGVGRGQIGGADRAVVAASIGANAAALARCGRDHYIIRVDRARRERVFGNCS